MSDDHSIPEPDVSAEHPISEHWIWMGPHRPAIPRQLVEFMGSAWSSDELTDEVHPGAAYHAARRVRLRDAYAGKTLVIPTGNPKVRANDTDYRFRPGSDFFYLTGCAEPDCVLVIGPGGEGTLYVAPRRDQRTHEFFTDARYGELWVGKRRGVDEAARYYAVATASLEYLAKDLSSIDPANILTLRGVDQSVDALVAPNEADHDLAEALGEARLVKDDFEVAQLQLAIDYTVKGFEDVARALPAARGRGERVIEGVFALRARVEGNDVGYSTIAASGANATILHWVENDGVVRDGDLLLLDAGVECHQLYTADVTRTIPINGTFTPAQRRVYDIVYRAQEAGIAAVRPGAAFAAAHDAATRVLVQGLIDLGILDDDLENALRRDRMFYRRYTLHGTSHMLGIDVHDCASARNDLYLGELREGYVLTVEPGLYFQQNDLTVPEEYRGIGVRIEDDILVSATGAVNLSAALPRDADAVEAWVRDHLAAGAPSLGL